MRRLLPLALLCHPAQCANVLVCYYSATNRTLQLATSVASGASKAGASVRLQAIADTEVEADVLKWADAVVIGSPVHYGNPAAKMQSWFETAWEPFWEDPRFEHKVGAVFTTGGGLAQGIEHVVASLQRLLASFRIQCLTPSPTRSGYNSYGAVAVTGTSPFNGSEIGAPFLKAGEDLGGLVAAAVLGRPQRSSVLSNEVFGYSTSSRGPVAAP